jgi:hypothetical protein
LCVVAAGEVVCAAAAGEAAGAATDAHRRARRVAAMPEQGQGWGWEAAGGLGGVWRLVLSQWQGLVVQQDASAGGHDATAPDHEGPPETVLIVGLPGGGLSALKLAGHTGVEPGHVLWTAPAMPPAGGQWVETSLQYREGLVGSEGQLELRRWRPGFLKLAKDSADILHVVVKRSADEAGVAAFELQRMPSAEPGPQPQPEPPKVPEIERLLKADSEYIKDIERLLKKDVEREPEPEPEPPKEPEIELLMKTLAEIAEDERTHKQKEASKKARADAKAAEPKEQRGP